VKPLLMLTVVLLAVILVLKGIFPALTKVRTDFANYYTSSYVLVHENRNIDKLYDADWFARKAAALGSPDGGIFQPFPPPTALLMVPLTIFDLQTAERIWTVLNVGILIVFVSTVSRLSAFDHVLSFFLVLVSGFALVNNFYLGQIHLLMVLCLALSIRYYLRGKDLLSGLYAGIFIPVKYFPICLLIFFVLQRRWFAVAAGVLVALILVCISLASMGWDIHWSYAQRTLVQHLDGQMANPFSARYQSWNSLLRSMFIGDATLNPRPLVDWPAGFAPLRAFVLVGLSAILSWVLWKGTHANVDASFQIAALFTFALLVAPATATYHFLLFSLPVTMVASQLLNAHRVLPLSILLILYAGMGAIPAGMLDRLDLQGAWRLLEFPRLFFLLAFFLTITLLTVSGGRREQSPQTL
jgi:hypothetical protein